MEMSDLVSKKNHLKFRAKEARYKIWLDNHKGHDLINTASKFRNEFSLTSKESDRIIIRWINS